MLLNYISAILLVSVSAFVDKETIKINGENILDTFNFQRPAQLHKIQALLDADIKSYLEDESINSTEEPNWIDTTEDPEAGPSKSLSWGVGMASGLVITLCSVCGLLLTPIINKPWYKKLLLYLIATATSSLMGNSLFQLIPPAYEIEMSEFGNIAKSVTIYVSFLFFFIIERILNIVFKERDDDDIKSVHSKQSHQDFRSRAGTLASKAAAGAVNAAVLENNQDDTPLTLVERMRKVKMVAWMLFVGDALENVADGMAMGAGFGTSIALGIGITIAIFSEEFPHKIGDFAIFLNAGMDVKLALIVNVISGATVWIGIVIGLLSAENEEITRYIFAIAGGVFLYVGLGGLFPEMGETSEELQEEGESGWKTLLIELAGLCTGLVMMILLCAFSDDIENAFE